MKKKLELTKFEIVWYIICATFGLWGLVYTILGLLANNLPIPSDKNALLNASKALASVFGLGFFGWGLIILGISAVAAVIVLLAVSKKADREYEKAQRRAARLNRANLFDDSTVENSEVVEAKFEEK